jgi:glutamyl-tRNA synthetase
MADVKNYIWYMYDELFTNPEYQFDEKFSKDDINEVLNTYFESYYDENDDKDTWFNKMKDMAEKLGYETNMKEYKEHPEAKKGSIADVSNIIRVGVTSLSQTPDLYVILKLLGKDRIKNRLDMLK